MMMWTKVKAMAAGLAVVGVLGTGVVMRVERASAQQGKGARDEEGAAVRERGTARVVAAEKLMEAMDAERDVGNTPLTPSFVDLYGAGLRRLAEARIEAAVDRAERVKAAEAYVRRCREMVEFARQRQGPEATMVQVRQIAYCLADAEYLLAKMRAAEAGR